jgi:hypothetical protein
MSVSRWLRNLWWARQRAVDMAVLWPVCKEEAPTLEYAKAAFAVHAFRDPAWIRYYGEDGLRVYIDALR